MINDKQRREAARGIRQFLSVSQNKRAWDNDGLQTVGRLVGTSVGENVLARLADLIDRPTCENGERLNERTFLCSACGYEAYTYSDSDCDPHDFSYCPKCGSEVVE